MKSSITKLPDAQSQTCRNIDWFTKTTKLLALIVLTSPLIVVHSADSAPIILPAETEISALAFSPDGKTLAIGTRKSVNNGYLESAVQLWDLQALKLIRTFPAKPWEGDEEANIGSYITRSLQFSPDGRSLVGTDGSGFVLWQIASGAEKFRWLSGVSDSTLSPGWSADSRWLALPSMAQERFSDTNGIALMDTSTGKRIAFFQVEIGYARTARISPDGTLLATAGHDCTVRVFDLGQKTSIFEDFAQTTMFVAAFSPDGRQLIAGSVGGGALLLYDVDHNSTRQRITRKGLSEKSREEIHVVEFTPDGKYAFTDAHMGIRVWRTKDWTTVGRIAECNGRLSPDGTRVALVRERAKNRVEFLLLSQIPKE